MDPISAIGFAASILTFVDFSWSLVHGAYQLRSSASGTTAENAHVKNVLDDLLEVTDDIDTNFKATGKHERALLRLAKNCTTVSKDLEKVLRKLQAKNDSTWESLKVTWRSMRKEKTVADIEKRLGVYREELIVRLNLIMS